MESGQSIAVISQQKKNTESVINEMKGLYMQTFHRYQDCPCCLTSCRIPKAWQAAILLPLNILAMNYHIFEYALTNCHGPELNFAVC